MSDKDPKQPSRRDFIFLATGAFAAVGAASIAWPIVAQMNPDATALALSKIEVDISQLERGQAITVKWRGKPVFIRRRTEEEIQMASRVDIDSLPDNNARNYNLSPDSAASDENRDVLVSAATRTAWDGKSMAPWKSFTGYVNPRQTSRCGQLDTLPNQN